MRDEDRPNLREQIGVAVSRAMREGDFTAAGALGAATLKLPSEQLERPDPAAWSEKRLIAEALWHAKYANDRIQERVAARCFHGWLGRQRMFEGYKNRQPWHWPTAEKRTRGDPLFWLACLVVREWIMDRCEECGGTGLKGVDPDQAARNVERYKRCDACKAHAGRPKVDHDLRQLVIDVPAGVYRRYWSFRFTWAAEQLAEIEDTIIGPLARQKRVASVKEGV